MIKYKVTMKLRTIFFFLILCFCSKVSFAKEINIILFSHNNNDQDYWGIVHQFARASAKDLGINLIIKYNDTIHRKSYIENMDKVLGAENVSAFLAVSFMGEAQSVLSLSSKYNIPVIMFDNTFSLLEKSKIGQPRVKYKNYIGHISPNDYQLGYLLADYLIKQAKENKTNKTIELIGISGSRISPESYERNKSLEMAANNQQAKLLQTVFASWNGASAYKKSLTLIKRHPNVDVIWAASDLMALAAKKAINESGKNIITGGIDWTPQAITAIKNGQLTASVGGNFTSAGYALVLLFDYLNGHDFLEKIALVYQVEGGVIHQGNVDKYYKLITEQDWHSIDFKKYSRVFNPNNEHYDFSFNRLVE